MYLFATCIFIFDKIFRSFAHFKMGSLFYYCWFWQCFSIFNPVLNIWFDVEAETPILWPPDAKSWLIWKDPDAGKDWGKEEKGITGWDGWMASPTQWTWVWVNSRSWWWTGRPGVLQFMGSHRVGHDWATELNWTELNLRKYPGMDLEVADLGLRLLW